uniref:Predicted protein n=1 Tax=Hordeum vulgare subsp. vulgare TaxID=112509 RepID=F2E0J7_HORVV|nr:predicted protein [Hordeum vulgare subsp. vulgare]
MVVHGGYGALKEVAETLLHTAAGARGHLRLRRSGGADALHPDTKADKDGGAGRCLDEGERLLLFHKSVHRHVFVAGRAATRAGDLGCGCRRLRR